MKIAYRSLSTMLFIIHLWKTLGQSDVILLSWQMQSSILICISFGHELTCYYPLSTPRFDNFEFSYLSLSDTSLFFRDKCSQFFGGCGIPCYSCYMGLSSMFVRNVRLSFTRCPVIGHHFPDWFFFWCSSTRKGQRRHHHRVTQRFFSLCFPSQTISNRAGSVSSTTIADRTPDNVSSTPAQCRSLSTVNPADE